MEQYIPKSALVAEIEKRIKTLNEKLIKHPISSPTLEKLIEENKKVLSFLDTLEVKEVDLDTEQRRYLTKHFNVYDDGILQSKKSQLPLSTYDVIKVAKHFFELGLKAQKGE